MSFTQIEKLATTAERRIRSSPPSYAFAETLNPIIKYAVGSKAKRFRPVLTMLVAQELAVPLAEIFPYALAIEYLHTASLIHDDLPEIDNDFIRRGEPSVHAKFGTANGVLSGDLCIVQGISALLESTFSDEKKIKLINLLANCWAKLCEGQARDVIIQNGKCNPNINDILKVHSLKTAPLISACCDGVCLISDGNDNNKLKQLQKFGACVGLLFQYIDDLIDYRETKISEKVEFCNLVFCSSEQVVLEMIKRVSEECEESLQGVVDEASGIHEVVPYLLNFLNSRSSE